METTNNKLRMDDLTRLINSKDIDCYHIHVDKLAQLRDLFPECSLSELSRYLLARHNHLKKASEQLSRALAFRASTGKVTKKRCERELQKGVLYLHGTDREHRPLLIFHTRLYDVDSRDLQETALLTVFWMDAAVRLLPPGKTKFTVLIDRTGSNKAVDMQFVKYLSTVFQDLYPERLYKVVVYPTGLVFCSVWALVKWFMEASTREKVVPASSLTEVRKLIDDKFIPACMGGDSLYVFNPEHADQYEDPYPGKLEYKDEIRGEREKFPDEGVCDTFSFNAACASNMRRSTDTKSEPTDIKPEPIDIKPEPIDIKPEPIDIKPEPTDAKSEPIDIIPEPTDEILSDSSGSSEWGGVWRDVASDCGDPSSGSRPSSPLSGSIVTPREASSGLRTEMYQLGRGDQQGRGSVEVWRIHVVFVLLLLLSVCSFVFFAIGAVGYYYI